MADIVDEFKDACVVVATGDPLAWQAHDRAQLVRVRGRVRVWVRVRVKVRVRATTVRTSATSPASRSRSAFV